MHQEISTLLPASTRCFVCHAPLGLLISFLDNCWNFKCHVFITFILTLFLILVDLQTQTVCNHTPSYANIVCSSTSEYDITSLSDLSCCGVCKIKDESPAVRKAIGIGVGVGIAGLLVLSVVVGFFVHRKIKEMIEIKKIKDANMPDYPGSPQNTHW